MNINQPESGNNNLVATDLDLNENLDTFNIPPNTIVDPVIQGRLIKTKDGLNNSDDILKANTSSKNSTLPPRDATRLSVEKNAFQIAAASLDCIKPVNVESQPRISSMTAKPSNDGTIVQSLHVPSYRLPLLALPFSRKINVEDQLNHEIRVEEEELQQVMEIELEKERFANGLEVPKLGDAEEENDDNKEKTFDKVLEEGSISESNTDYSEYSVVSSSMDDDAHSKPNSESSIKKNKRRRHKRKKNNYSCMSKAKKDKLRALTRERLVCEVTHAEKGNPYLGKYSGSAIFTYNGGICDCLGMNLPLRSCPHFRHPDTLLFLCSIPARLKHLNSFISHNQPKEAPSVVVNATTSNTKNQKKKQKKQKKTKEEKERDEINEHLCSIASELKNRLYREAIEILNNSKVCRTSCRARSYMYHDRCAAPEETTSSTNVSSVEHENEKEEMIEVCTLCNQPVEFCKCYENPENPSQEASTSLVHPSSFLVPQSRSNNTSILGGNHSRSITLRTQKSTILNESSINDSCLPTTSLLDDSSSSDSTCSCSSCPCDKTCSCLSFDDPDNESIKKTENKALRNLQTPNTSASLKKSSENMVINDVIKPLENNECFDENIINKSGCEGSGIETNYTHVNTSLKRSYDQSDSHESIDRFDSSTTDSLNQFKHHHHHHCIHRIHTNHHHDMICSDENDLSSENNNGSSAEDRRNKKKKSHKANKLKEILGPDVVAKLCSLPSETRAIINDRAAKLIDELNEIEQDSVDEFKKEIGDIKQEIEKKTKNEISENSVDLKKVKGAQSMSIDLTKPVVELTEKNCPCCSNKTTIDDLANIDEDELREQLAKLAGDNSPQTCHVYRAILMMFNIKDENEVKDSKGVIKPEHPDSVNQKLQEEKFKKYTRLPTILSYTSLTVNICLLILKAVAYIFSKSASVFASMLDSILDILSNLVLFFAATLTRKMKNAKQARIMQEYKEKKKKQLNAQEKHKRKLAKLNAMNYGTTRFEAVAVLAFVAVMAAMALNLIIDQAQILIAFFGGDDSAIDVPNFDGISMAIILIAVFAKVIMSIISRIFGKLMMDVGASDNGLCATYAKEGLNDGLSNTVGFITALVAARVPSVKFIDSIGALIISVYITVSFFMSALESMSFLSGKVCGNIVYSEIAMRAMHYCPWISRITYIDAYHTSANTAIVELHITAYGAYRLNENSKNPRLVDISLERAQRVTRKLRHFIEKKTNSVEVEKCIICLNPTREGTSRNKMVAYYKSIGMDFVE